MRFNVVVIIIWYGNSIVMLSFICFELHRRDMGKRLSLKQWARLSAKQLLL